MDNTKRTELNHLQSDLADELSHNAQYKALLALAMVVTLISYLFFSGHLKLGNPLYWGEYFSNGSATMVAFFFMFVSVILLGVFLAWVKHFSYSHFTTYRAIAGVMVTLVGFALMAEMFAALEDQKAKADIQLEGNAAYKATIAPTISSISAPPALAGDIAAASQKLARCQANLGKPGYKHCDGDKAALAALEKQQSAALNAQVVASAESEKLRYERQDKMKADAHNDFIVGIAKFYSNLMGTGAENEYIAYISWANITLMLIIAVAFERLHAFLIEAGRDIKGNIRALEQRIAQLQDNTSPLAGYSTNRMPVGQPLFGYQRAEQQQPPAPTTEKAEQPAVGSAHVSGLVSRAKEAIGNEMLKANAGREQAHRVMGEALGQVGDKIDNLTQPVRDQSATSPKNVDTSPSPVLKTPDQSATSPEKTLEPTGTSPSKLDLWSQVDEPVRDQSDRRRESEHNRPTLDSKTAVSMISAQVRGQIDSGKLPAALRPVLVACRLAYDQLATLYPLPALDLELVARAILDNYQTATPEPDLIETTASLHQSSPTSPALPVPPHQTGLVEKDWSEQGLVKNQPDPEAVKKQAEIEELKRKLADQSAAIETAQRAKAEADRARAEADRKASEAAAKAKADAEARAAAAKAAQEEADRKAAEEAERGDLTEAQIALATQVLADAIRAGQLGESGAGLGNTKTAPILKAAGLPRSTTTLKALNKLAGKRLVESGLAANHRNPGNGNPLYVIRQP